MPVVSYNFDNDSGTTVVDSSDRKNNGTWGGTPAYGAGASGKALHVSAGKNFVSLPKVAGQTDGSGSFAIETWWYDNSETSDAPMIANQNFASCSNPGFTFYHLSGTYQQRSCFGINGTKTYTTTRTTSIQNGWHHLALVVDSTAHTFDYYVDGVLFSSTSTISGSSVANFNSGLPFRIGQDGTGTYSATDDALVDDFNFYNQAISADQIAADYAATNPATHFPVTVTNDGHGTGTASVLAPAAGETDKLTAKPDTGYTFDSWVPVTPSTLEINSDGTFTAPGSPVTVKATFRPNTYTVTYEGNGADGGAMSPQTLTYDQAAALTANHFTNAGKHFMGWSLTPNGALAYTDQDSVKNLTSTDNGNVTLYAQWAPAGTFQVTETGDSHVKVSSSSDSTGGWVAPGSKVTLTATPATGYSSTWQADSPADLTIADDGTFTMPSQNVVIKAVSSANKYTVVFDGNGATGGATATQPFTYDRSAALTANGFKRDGYGFLGWATSPTGKPAYTDGQNVTNLTATADGKVTLYAVWSRYRAAGDTTAPVASYDFDADKNGAVSDGSGQGNNAVWKGTPAYAKGLSGRAAHVSAGTNFLQLPKVAGQTDGSGSFSFSTWWGEYGETSDSPLVSNQNFGSCTNAGVSLHHLSGTSTTRACWGQPTGSTRQYSETNPTALKGKWHYLTVVVDRSAQKMSYYVDGALFTTSSASQITSATNFNSGLPFTIGQDGTGTYTASVDALVDHLDFYNQPLTAAQVANDYNATKPADAVLPDESTVDVPTTPVATVPEGFVTDTFHAPQARVKAAVSQSVAGLWNGNAVTSYKKTSGDSWLSVDAHGVVSGTAPSTALQHPGTITVQATDGTTTSQITVEVPVIAADDAPQVAAATWNLWDAGKHVDDSLLKNLTVIANNGLDVIGVQEDGGTGAHQLAKALGWYDYEGAGGLGIVSAWPISSTGVVAATDSAPAVGVTVNVGGRNVRVWNAALDETTYGPEQACAKAGTDASAVVAAEKASTRYAQAQAIAAAIKPEVDSAETTPVVFLGDLASPSAADWTEATAAKHCNVGAVHWPVPDAITGTGLTDSFRKAHPDPAADPGNTWSPIVTTNPTTGAAEPHDRIDYVDYAGSDLHMLGSNTLVAGWPSDTDGNANAWTSDHTAVVTTFTLGTPLPSAPAPTVTVDKDALVYQAGHGPADDAALRSAIGVTSDSADATITVDSSDVDYRTAGYYTVLVTAQKDGYVSDPVAVTVHVVPVVKITLANDSVSLAGPGMTEAAVLDAFGGRLNVPGTIKVDLSRVNTSMPGSYPVTVTGTDDYGFTATKQATVVIMPVVPKMATTAPAAQYGTAATVTVTVSAPGLPVTGTVTLNEGATPRGKATLTNGRATFTLPIGLAVGSHVMLASYSGSDVLTPEAQTLTVTVSLPQAWSASTSYRTGDKVGYQGKMYMAAWSTQNQNPGDPQGPWEEIAMTEDGTAIWTASRIFNAGDVAVYDGKTFKADWRTRNEVPGDPTGSWEEQAPPGPNGIAAWTPTTIYNSGDRVTYQGSTYQAQWYTRNQTPGTPSGPWKKTS
ncbi:LamG-like jellyroll fold domain-containing protein [Streptomyces sp. NPDC056190]|uniref:LamG-like jellyroll fold domain-containing protein n=1 Tax=Streptomyces sp. NPDC056190 TaxID=3345741 RepID=UPI0035D55490